MIKKLKTLACLKVIIYIIVSGMVLSTVSCSSAPSASFTPSTPAASATSAASPSPSYSATPNETQIQQTLDAAIQQQVTAAVQSTIEAVQTQDQILTLTAIGFAVQATLDMPTHQAATEAAIATATARTIPTFFDVNSNVEDIIRFEIRNNDTGEFLVLERDSNQLWSIVDGTNLQEANTDQLKVANTLEFLKDINPIDSFEGENLSDFGLDNPHFIILVTVENQSYELRIGNRSPTTPHYYAQVGTPRLTIYTVMKDFIDILLRRIDDPPYETEDS